MKKPKTDLVTRKDVREYRKKRPLFLINRKVKSHEKVKNK